MPRASKTRLAILLLLAHSTATHADRHHELVAADKPAAYWRLDDALDCCAQDAAFQHHLKAQKTDSVSFADPGPRAPKFPGFDEYNVAADFTAAEGPGHLLVKDPGPRSILDFTLGDTLALEVWVQCHGLRDAQQVNIATKGDHTQENWALLLTGARVEKAPVARLTFAYRTQNPAAHYRWTSDLGFPPGEDWHHVTLQYSFGRPDSLRATINGTALTGKWSEVPLAGAAPVETDQPLWVGGDSTQKPDTQFPGRIDELAIFRAPIAPEKIKQRSRRSGLEPRLR